MKFFHAISVTMVFLLLVGSNTHAQEQVSGDSTGLPGDNFDLKGALDLFKNSGSPEAFEKALNSENSNVNNLDLNEDGNIDYIKVVARKDGSAQDFILQAPISENENQDIAVIELEKTGDKSAVVQIIGDEDIYGEEKIIEPSDDDKETGYLDPADNAFGFQNLASNGPNAITPAGHPLSRIIVNVWAWPVVRFVYGPSYTVWISPWNWNRRPVWWRPWRPFTRTVFYARRPVFHKRYIAVRVYRAPAAHRIYRPVRTTSVTFRARNQANIGRYKATRTTKTYHGRRGKEVKVSRTHVRRRR